MQLVCRCLNVTVNVVIEEERFAEAVIKLESVLEYDDDDEMTEDPFFALCERGGIARMMLDSENGIVEKLPALIRKRNVSGWDIRKCMLCGTDAYASRANTGAGQVLVNAASLLHDKSVIAELRKSAAISPVFQVVLPKDTAISPSVDADIISTNTAGTKSGSVGGATTTVIPRGALQAAQNCVSQYLMREQEKMEERIRVFVEEQQAAFDRLKAEAKAQKALALTLIAKNGANDFYYTSNGLSYEDDFDSAVPLSPLSLTSADPSPGVTTPAYADNFQAVRNSVDASHLQTDMANVTTPLRPKAHSNPASLSGWKRKRHSGGSGIPPSLSSHPEEQQDIFSFEEQQCEETNATYLPADDEGDTTDDSGTGEDYSKYYPVASGNSSNTTIINQSSNGGSGTPRLLSHYGTSLPVRVPNIMPRWPYREMSDEDMVTPVAENGNAEEEAAPKDVGASMQALARSIQGADDPERLFGERPQRRRWKTGDISREQCQQYPTAQREYLQRKNSAVVVVLKQQQENI